jgi:NAD(P)-dependent dehydrogenase (short-subunit alcohol dehydrogenase family)
MKALITGANKGIGYEIARALGKRGYEVLVGARDEKRGQEAVAKLTAEGFQSQWIKIDLNDFATLANAAEHVGQLDLLVNNAGIPGNLTTEKSTKDMQKSAFAYTTDDLRQTMEVNFFATHELIKQLLPHLADDGKIVNLTIPISGNQYWQPLAYLTSKAAQNSMTMVLGNEWIKQESRRQIFGVMPGAVATDLNGQTAGGFVKTAEEAASVVIDFIFDGKNHNAHILEFSGLEISSYERN